MDSRLLFLPTIVVSFIAIIVWWYLRTVDFGIIMGVVGFINLAAAWWITRERRDWWSFSIVPALLLWSSLSYSLVVLNSSIALISVIVATVLAILYWRLVFLYAFNHTAYRPFSLERLFGYASFIILFFSISAAYSLKTFLDLPTWQPATIILLIVIGLAYQWQWMQKIDWKQAWPYVVLFPIAITELFFVAAFLPLDSSILGFLLASTWYAISYLAATNVAGRLTPQQLRLISGTVIFLWIILLLTARWF